MEPEDIEYLEKLAKKLQKRGMLLVHDVLADKWEITIDKEHFARSNWAIRGNTKFQVTVSRAKEATLEDAEPLVKALKQDGFQGSSIVEPGERITLTGRVTNPRHLGKATFFDLALDMDQSIQIYAKHEKVPEVVSLAFGDYVEVTGEAFLTRLQVLTIDADQLQRITEQEYTEHQAYLDEYFESNPSAMRMCGLEPEPKRKYPSNFKAIPMGEPKDPNTPLLPDNLFDPALLKARAESIGHTTNIEKEWIGKDGRKHTGLRARIKPDLTTETGKRLQQAVRREQLRRMAEEATREPEEAIEDGEPYPNATSPVNAVPWHCEHCAKCGKDLENMTLASGKERGAFMQMSATPEPIHMGRMNFFCFPCFSAMFYDAFHNSGEARSAFLKRHTTARQQIDGIAGYVTIPQSNTPEPEDAEPSTRDMEASGTVATDTHAEALEKRLIEEFGLSKVIFCPSPTSNQHPTLTERFDALEKRVNRTLELIEQAMKANGERN